MAETVHNLVQADNVAMKEIKTNIMEEGTAVHEGEAEVQSAQNGVIVNGTRDEITEADQHTEVKQLEEASVSEEQLIEASNKQEKLENGIETVKENGEAMGASEISGISAADVMEQAVEEVEAAADLVNQEIIVETTPTGETEVKEEKSAKALEEEIEDQALGDRTEDQVPDITGTDNADIMATSMDGIEEIPTSDEQQGTEVQESSEKAAEPLVEAEPENAKPGSAADTELAEESADTVPEVTASQNINNQQNMSLEEKHDAALGTEAITEVDGLKDVKELPPEEGQGLEEARNAEITEEAQIIQEVTADQSSLLDASPVAEGEESTEAEVEVTKEDELESKASESVKTPHELENVKNLSEEASLVSEVEKNGCQTLETTEISEENTEVKNEVAVPSKKTVKGKKAHAEEENDISSAPQTGTLDEQLKALQSDETTHSTEAPKSEENLVPMVMPTNKEESTVNRKSSLRKVSAADEEILSRKISDTEEKISPRKISTVEQKIPSRKSSVNGEKISSRKSSSAEEVSSRRTSAAEEEIPLRKASAAEEERIQSRRISKVEEEKIPSRKSSATEEDRASVRKPSVEEKASRKISAEVDDETVSKKTSKSTIPEENVTKSPPKSPRMPRSARMEKTRAAKAEVDETKAEPETDSLAEPEQVTEETENKSVTEEEHKDEKLEEAVSEVVGKEMKVIPVTSEGEHAEEESKSPATAPPPLATRHSPSPVRKPVERSPSPVRRQGKPAPPARTYTPYDQDTYRPRGPPPRMPSYSTFSSYAPVEKAAYAPISPWVQDVTHKYHNEYTATSTYRPPSTYTSIFDDIVNSGPFASSLYSASRLLERSRSRSRELRNALRSKRSASNYYRYTSNYATPPTRTRDYSTPPLSSVHRVPSRSGSFISFLEYSDQKQFELARSLSRHSTSESLMRTSSRPNIDMFYDTGRLSRVDSYVRDLNRHVEHEFPSTYAKYRSLSRSYMPQEYRPVNGYRTYNNSSSLENNSNFSTKRNTYDPAPMIRSMYESRIVDLERSLSRERLARDRMKAKYTTLSHKLEQACRQMDLLRTYSYSSIRGGTATYSVYSHNYPYF